MRGTGAPACTGPCTSQPAPVGLTFEQFVDVMVLCAVAAFGSAPEGGKPHVVFNGEPSTQAKALWTNHSEVLARSSLLLFLCQLDACT